ncbi:MAG: 50S ribosomal protein L21 [bacterium]|nr:50S ribosomal protein L21 [bacterium]
MLAIIEVKGHQYKVNKNDIIITEKIDADEGQEIEIDKVLLYYDKNELHIGKPYLDMKLKAKVLKHFKGDKIVIFKYTPKKRYRRKRGHRQLLTKLQII